MNGLTQRSLVTAVVAALALVALPGETASAQGGAASALDDLVRALPRVKPRPLRLPQVRLVPPRPLDYGLTDRAVISTLDDAKAQAVSTTDSTAAEIGQQTTSPSEVEGAARGCAKAGFKQAAKDYFSADSRQAAYPFFNNVFYYAVHGCLSDQFPGAPGEAVTLASNLLTDRVSGAANTVVITQPRAFANWLDATGDEVTDTSESEPVEPTEPSEPTEPPVSDPGTEDTSDGGGSSGGWLLLGLAAAGIVGAAIYFGRKS